MGNEKRGGQGIGRESWTEVERDRPTEVEVEPVRPGSLLGGRYVVEAIIGRGGMGIVVRAHDRTLGTTVAIKILRAELTGEAYWADRLAREVKLARQIQHQNVCRVFDFEQAEGRVFLVMELATEGTLRDELAAGRTRARPLAEALADARAVAAGLGAIHDAGIVHRDLSPQNLLRMGDGRVVLSDFGLATDPSETTTSIRGGTIAYMAPEIVRGAKAGIASDIWALGVVVHEVVFGDKPIWRGKRGTELVAPALGRPLSRAERAVLEVCRACSAAEPGRRPARAGEVAARLTEAALAKTNWRRWAVRAGVVACAATAVAAGPALVRRLRRRVDAAVVAAANVTSPLLQIFGEPADWTDTARVLGEIRDRVHCAVPLPDQHTVRIVWGRPPHAEDVDTKTGRRVPAPVVPSAYVEGCPDLSPDGKRIVYQGHTPDGRAFAFVAENPEGRDAVPVVPTAEPTHLSEPRWLADGRTFSYDVDMRHIGVFSLVTRRTTVVSTVAESASGSNFRWTSGESLLVEAVEDPRNTEVVELDGRSLTESRRFRLPALAMDLVAAGDGTYRGVLIGSGEHDGVFEADVAGRRARRVGFFPGQEIRRIVSVDDGLFFTTWREATIISLPALAGQPAASFRLPGVVGAAAACGSDVLLSEIDNSAARIVRRRRNGEFVRYLTDGPTDVSVSCAGDGRWFYVRAAGSESSVIACDALRCRQVTVGRIWRAQISPDGAKLALLTSEKRGPTVSWIDLGEPDRVHSLQETETSCPPVWSRDGSLWISRRMGAALVWVEVDIAAGTETGRRMRGTTDCSDGVQDPALPERAEAQIAAAVVSQLRVISEDALTRRSL